MITILVEQNVAGTTIEVDLNGTSREFHSLSELSAWQSNPSLRGKEALLTAWKDESCVVDNDLAKIPVSLPTVFK